jgi:hypothetical protein
MAEGGRLQRRPGGAAVEPVGQGFRTHDPWNNAVVFRVDEGAN